MDAAARLAELGAELRAFAPLWSAHAFRQRVLGWEADEPGLAAALRALPLEEAERLHADARARDAFLARWLPVGRWRALEALPRAPARALEQWPRALARDVPGRKWLQVEAFARAVAAPGGDLEGLDWCAGKGHLARALCAAWGGRPFVALEREQRLVGDCERLARRDALPVRAARCDVLSPAAGEWLGQGVHAVALHACGALHLRLFELAAATGTPAISCAPCCYHLGAPARPVALSPAGAAAWPGLAAADLRTAVQETVTAGAGVRRRRRALQAWQLGFDALARELRGVDDYLPLPAVGAADLARGFAHYCARVAALKGLGLPPWLDYAAWEAAGHRRYREVTALDLVRQRFGRLLELWLVLDRAAWLAGRGYAVQVQTFCERTLTPRNLLLEARRAA